MNRSQLIATCQEAVTRAGLGGLAWRRRQSLLTMGLLIRLRRLWRRGNRPRRWAKMKGQSDSVSTPAASPIQPTATAAPGSSADVASAKPEAPR